MNYMIIKTNIKVANSIRNNRKLKINNNKERSMRMWSKRKYILQLEICVHIMKIRSRIYKIRSRICKLLLIIKKKLFNISKMKCKGKKRQKREINNKHFCR